MKKRKILKIVLALLGIIAVLLCAALPIFADSGGATFDSPVSLLPGVTLNLDTPIGTAYASDFASGVIGQSATYGSAGDYFYWKTVGLDAREYPTFNLTVAADNTVGFRGITIDAIPVDFIFRTPLPAPAGSSTYSFNSTDGNPISRLGLNIVTNIPNADPAPSRLRLRVTADYYAPNVASDGHLSYYLEDSGAFVDISGYYAKQGSETWVYVVPLWRVIETYYNACVPDIPAASSYPVTPLSDLNIFVLSDTDSPGSVADVRGITLNSQKHEGDEPREVFTREYLSFQMAESLSRFLDYPVPETVSLDEFNLTSFIANSTRGFFEAEFFPGFSVGGLFAIVFSMLCLFAVLRFFAGG